MLIEILNNEKYYGDVLLQKTYIADYFTGKQVPNRGELNMDNIHLQTEVKPIAKNEGKMKLLKARYKYSMVLLGLSVLGYYENHKTEEEGKPEESPEEAIRKISEMLSPVILPMIDVMGDDMSDILG